MSYNNYNKLLLIRNVQQLAHKHYEPGRQDRNWTWVWKFHVDPVYPMSYNTFMKHLKVDTAGQLAKLDAERAEKEVELKKIH